MIEENLRKINDEIKNKNVTLIAVSKTKPIEDIMAAYNFGQRDFGENYVQELLSKIDNLPSDINWHLIGHLQTNKVKDVVGKVKLIQSVDSIKLAEKISKEAGKKNIVQDILLEINLGKEESKTGIIEEDLDNILNNIKNLPNIRILGLMGVVPNRDNNKKLFTHLKELANIYNEKYHSFSIDLSIISMGMSHDYLDAIECGSNMIRVGTNIFGERNYN